MYSIHSVEVKCKVKKDVSKSKQIVATLLLMLAAFIWGTAFVAQKQGLDLIGNFTFLAARSWCAVVVLLPVSFFLYKVNKKKVGEGEYGENKTYLSGHLIVGGLLCGVALFLASLLQQYGIILSGVGKSGFLTTLYILIVPILGVFFKRKIPRVLWLCIAIAVCGMYFLCVTEAGSINAGDLLLILCAVLFAVQIMIVDSFIVKVDGVRLSLVQFFVLACISTVGAILFEEISPQAIYSAAGSILYAGVLSSGVAYTLQIVAQKNLNATVASLLMSLESVFAALAGAFFGERLTGNEIFGCFLVFTAIIIAQLPTEDILSKFLKRK